MRNKGGIAQKRFLHILPTSAQVRAFFAAHLVGENAQKRTERCRNAQKCTKTRHFAQTHATPPFIIPLLSEELKKAVAVSGGANPAFPKARPIFQQPFSLPESAQSLAGTAFRAAGKSGKNFPAAPKIAGKPFQQGISDSHSLLEFSDVSVQCLSAPRSQRYGCECECEF